MEHHAEVLRGGVWRPRAPSWPDAAAMVLILSVFVDVSDQIARQELDAVSQSSDGGVAVNDEAQRNAAQSLIEVAAQLARHEGRGDVQRAAEITRWCE